MSVPEFSEHHDGVDLEVHVEDPRFRVDAPAPATIEFQAGAWKLTKYPDQLHGLDIWRFGVRKTDHGDEVAGPCIAASVAHGLNTGGDSIASEFLLGDTWYPALLDLPGNLRPEWCLLQPESV